MPFYMVRIFGRLGGKRASVEPETFDTYDAAAAVAQARWPEEAHFIVEADDEVAAGRAAIRESQCLDELTP